jgi:hypothetical protein
MIRVDIPGWGNIEIMRKFQKYHEGDESHRIIDTDILRKRGIKDGIICRGKMEAFQSHPFPLFFLIMESMPSVVQR